MSRSDHLEIIPLGGLGEFGMNLMVYRCGRDALVVDAGLMFPSEPSFGVDVVIPHLSFLEDCGTLHGVVLTHAHEDHIGALPHLLSRFDVPVYGPPHARELARLRLGEHDSRMGTALAPLPTGEPLELGPFVVRAVPATHSVPQSRMVVLDTPAGRVVHTADFKLAAPGPDGDRTDPAFLRAIGDEGVLALLSDSTNAEEPGMSPGEPTVAGTLDRLLASAPRRVLVTCFSSNVERLATLGRLAALHGRKLALAGTSIETQVEIAERLGLLRFPPGLRVPPAMAMGLPPREALIVATGSQGEPRSTLARIAAGRHPEIALEPGDLLVHSARVIPGNERRVGRMVDRLLEQGVEVLTERQAQVHVSGHPARDELALLLDWVRPKYLLPIHGEYRQLAAHARLAVERGLDSDRCLVAQTGDHVVASERELRVVGSVPAGRVCIDASLGEIDPRLLRERRRIAEDGIVLPVVSFDGRGAPVLEPRILSRGFVPEDDDLQNNGLLGEAQRLLEASLSRIPPGERNDEARVRSLIESDLRRFLRRRTQRRPVIAPVIVER